VFYCTGELSEQEIQSVGYNYLPVKNMMKLYNPAKLTEGVNVMPGGEEIFFISNPALGLWSTKDKF
jgi:hypothetical protein